MNKRLDMRLCPACSGSVIHPDSHGPEDDLADIRKRDAAYNGEVGMSLTNRALNNGDLNGRMQMAADRRMLLRMLDAELAGDKAEAPPTTAREAEPNVPDVLAREAAKRLARLR